MRKKESMQSQRDCAGGTPGGTPVPGKALRSLTRMFCRVAVLCLVFFSAALAQSGRYERLDPKVIESRLQQYAGSNLDREATLSKLFSEAGCSGDRLKEQPVTHSKAPNVICTLPGSGNGVIVVGAHFDYVSDGSGVADNWSGASLLPSLYQSLSEIPRTHTFVFLGFTDEEKGFLGSRAYVAGLGKEEIARIQGMIDMDTLGLGPTEIWVSNSDPGLVKQLSNLAWSMKLPVSGMNVDGVGDSDGHFFKDRGIPIITLHSVTSETLSILHSRRDNIAAIKFSDYYDSYKLIAAYLVLLDSALGSSPK